MDSQPTYISVSGVVPRENSPTRHSSSASGWEPENEPVLREDASTIYASQPDIGQAEFDIVMQNLQRGWLSGRAPVVAEFENTFAATVGVRYAVACNSGGSALYLLLRAAGIGPGDEVIVPSYTMIATAGAVSLLGATPVFVDCDPATLNIDPSLLEDALSPQTKAVLCVHLYGCPCDMTSLRAFCSRRGVALFEDAAEAHGAAWNGVLCGALSDAAAFGFYGNKTITGGEGGIITTDDAQLAERARSLRSYCFAPGRHFWHADIGHSYRLPALSAALCLVQTRRMQSIVEKRRAIARHYDALLRESPANLRRVPSDIPPEAEHSWWFYCVRVPMRGEVRSFLAAEAIETRPGFVPMHRQPCYRTHWTSRVAAGGCPEAEAAGREVLLLPTHTCLTAESQERIVERLTAAIASVS
jgi:perosamine synthetase